MALASLKKKEAIILTETTVSYFLWTSAGALEVATFEENTANEYTNIPGGSHIPFET
jgi:hypothetical protein